MRALFDASALLAILFEERGAETALAHARGTAILAVNLAEVAEKIARIGLDPRLLIDSLRRTEIEVLAFIDRRAMLAADLKNRPGFAGISLADRACLATALDGNRRVVTADRAWSDLSLALDIIQIR